MDIITPRELVKTLPDNLSPEAGMVVALEVNFERLVAQVYRMENNRIHLEKHLTYPQWTFTYEEKTRRIQDPLMNTLLIKLGIYWNRLLEIRLDDVLDAQSPLLHQFLASLVGDYKVGHVTLLGELGQMENLRQAIGTRLATDSLYWDDTLTSCELADEKTADNIADSIAVVALQDYYDLLVLDMDNHNLCWKRTALFGPGMPPERTQLTFLVAPQTEKCLFLIGKFPEPATGFSIGLHDITADMIIFAREVRGIEGRTRVRYNIRINSREQFDVSFDGCTDASVSHLDKKLADIGRISLQTIPMQTAFIIDGTLTGRQFRRSKDLMKNVVAGQSAEWIMFLYTETNVDDMMGNAFLPTFDFIQSLEKYNHEHHPNDLRRMRKIFDRLASISWSGDSANYFVFITQCFPSDNVESAVSVLKSRLNIDGIVIYMGDPTLVKDEHVVGFVPMGDIIINELDTDIDYISNQLRGMLTPSEQKKRHLTDLPVPISPSLEGR